MIVSIIPATTLPIPYQAAVTPRRGLFLAIEGVGIPERGTLVELLARRLDARILPTTAHTETAPLVGAAVPAPLPQLVGRLTEALHASDTVRAWLRHGNVVADRYLTATVAEHALLHGIDPRCVLDVTAPFHAYLLQPDMTVYLHASGRTAHEQDPPFADTPDLRARADELYRELAHDDPTAAHVEATGRSPEELADQIVTLLGVDARPTG